MVGLFLAAPCSQHISFFFSLLRFMEWVSGGGAAGGEKKEKEKKMKMHLICPAISRLVSAEWVVYRGFLCFSRTHLCTRSSEGLCFTATSNCPQATGSHFQAGSFIFRWKRKWSFSLILNHPHATAYKVIKEGPVCAVNMHKHARRGHANRCRNMRGNVFSSV